MKNVKPGRGPSLIEFIMSMVFILFSFFWTFAAVRSGAPFVFFLFGAMFVGVGILQVVRQIKRVIQKKRDSAFDMTDTSEELAARSERFEEPPLSDDTETDAPTLADSNIFCPYCGAPARSSYTFCRNCDKQLPQ